MQAVLIDPYTKTVTRVATTATMEELYLLLDCQMVERVVLSNYRKGNKVYSEDLWIDEEGFLRNPTAGFQLGPNHTFVGKGLVLGRSPEGDCISTTSQAHLVIKLVKFKNFDENNPVPQPFIGVIHSI